MKTIHILTEVGSFAENKDKARTIRKNTLNPAIAKGEKVILDFSEVTGTTQSFIHALLSELFRTQGSEVLDYLVFKKCNDSVTKIIGIVTDYMQDI